MSDLLFTFISLELQVDNRALLGVGTVRPHPRARPDVLPVPDNSNSTAGYLSSRTLRAVGSTRARSTIYALKMSAIFRAAAARVSKLAPPSRVATAPAWRRPPLGLSRSRAPSSEPPTVRAVNRGVLKVLDPIDAGTARELIEMREPSDVLAHHAENADDYDVVSASTALARVAAGGGVARWRRAPVDSSAVDALAAHTTSLVRAELRKAADGLKTADDAGARRMPDTRAIASSLSSLAKLGRAPRSLLDETSFVLARALAGGKPVNSRDVADIAFAFSRANAPAPALFNALSESACARSPPLAGYDDRDVASLLLSFSSLRIAAPALYAGAAQHFAARSTGDTLGPQTLANVTLAFSRSASDDTTGVVRARTLRRAMARAAAALGEDKGSGGALPPPPTQSSTAAVALSALAPRIERTARAHRVPGVSQHAFTATGLAQIAWAYSRGLKGVGRAASSHVPPAVAVRVLRAISSAFTHPQTIATASPSALVTFAAALRDAHVAIATRVDAGKEEGGGGSVCGGESSTLLTQLAVGTALPAIARAAVRILDAGAAGVVAVGVGSVGGGAWESAKTIAGAGGGAVAPEGLNRAAFSLSDEQRALAEDEVAAEALLAGVIRGSGDGEETGGAGAAPRARYSPLQYERSLAASLRFSMHDVAQLATVFCDVGYTVEGMSSEVSGGVALAECWAKLADRVVRGAVYSAPSEARAGEGPDVDDGGAGTDGALFRSQTTEGFMRDMNARDAAALAAAFALAAPRAHAARVLRAVCDVFVASDTKNFDVGYERDRKLAASRTAPPGRVSSLLSSSTTAVRGLLPDADAPQKNIPPFEGDADGGYRSDETPSFDEEPTWGIDAREAVSRARSFRSAPARGVYRLRGAAVDGGNLLERGGGGGGGAPKR